MSDKFYVYEHWRPDKNEPFWVGKGHGGRAQYFVRGNNHYYNNTVAKLSRLGMCVEVRMVESNLGEREALALETIRILYWRSRGIKLANMTDGGEGLSNPLPEVRARIAAANSIALKGHKHTPETVAKMRAAHQGQVCSPETRSKLSARIFTPEWCAKISAAKKGKPKSLEHRAKLRAASLGNTNKKKMKRIELQCTHCNNTFTVIQNSKRKFCSISCSAKHQWENLPA